MFSSTFYRSVLPRAGGPALDGPGLPIPPAQELPHV